MIEHPTFATRSLYCAAAMLAAGATFEAVQPGDSGRVCFVFANDGDKAWQLALAYSARTMQPAPQPSLVIDALFRLRDEMRQHAGR